MWRHQCSSLWISRKHPSPSLHHSLAPTCRRPSLGARSQFGIYELKSHEVHSWTLQKVQTHVPILCPNVMLPQEHTGSPRNLQMKRGSSCLPCRNFSSPIGRCTDRGVMIHRGYKPCHLQKFVKDLNSLWVVFTFLFVFGFHPASILSLLWC